MLCQVSENVFKLSQLRSEKNNVRPENWNEMLQSRQEDNLNMSKVQLDVSLLKPTPHYNMCILEDVTMLSISNLINNSIKSCPPIRKAIVLWKVQ
jgi:hypothetical protein